MSGVGGGYQGSFFNFTDLFRNTTIVSMIRTYSAQGYSNYKPINQYLMVENTR
jgi:hypothetical protein